MAAVVAVMFSNCNRYSDKYNRNDIYDNIYNDSLYDNICNDSLKTVCDDTIPLRTDCIFGICLYEEYCLFDYDDEYVFPEDIVEVRCSFEQMRDIFECMFSTQHSNKFYRQIQIREFSEKYGIIYSDSIKSFEVVSLY